MRPFFYLTLFCLIISRPVFSQENNGHGKIRADGYYCYIADSCTKYRFIVFNDTKNFSIFTYCPDDNKPLPEILLKVESFVSFNPDFKNDYSEYTIENDKIKLRLYDITSREHYSDWYGIIKDNSIELISFKHSSRPEVQPLNYIFEFKPFHNVQQKH